MVFVLWLTLVLKENGGRDFEEVKVVRSRSALKSGSSLRESW